MRNETITVTDANGNTLDTYTSGTFTTGAYVVWTIQGSVTFTFQSIAGTNAVVSGAFID